MNKLSTYYKQEKELIDGLIAKKVAAYETLYADNRDKLISLVKNNNGNQEDAEDVIQESVVVLYKKLNNPEFELNSKIGTFLYAIAKRIWLSKLKIRSKKRVTSDENLQLSDGSNIEEKFLEKERYSLYRKILLRMGSDCKKVLLMFFENFSMEEIAKEFNYGSAGYAKRKKYKCKKKLIELIKNDPLFNELRS